MLTFVKNFVWGGQGPLGPLGSFSDVNAVSVPTHTSCSSTVLNYLKSFRKALRTIQKLYVEAPWKVIRSTPVKMKIDLRH